jgi:hypothetical protein
VNNLITIVVILIPLVYVLFADYKRGIFMSVFLMVLLPPQLAIITPGDLPDFTIHRLILTAIIGIWLLRHRTHIRISDIPLARYFIILVTGTFITVLFAVDFIFSFKSFLSLTLEVVLFYFIIMTTMENRTDVQKLITAAALGLGLVAFIGFIENYSGFNPVDRYVSGYLRLDKNFGDVLSTYPHRILFGAAMAMGWPLTMVIAARYRDRLPLMVLLILAAAAMLAGVYFSDSRGAWLGAILGGMVLFVFGRVDVRRSLAAVAVIGLMVVLIRPGVRAQILDRVQSTQQTTSFRGGTYQYRWELWNIAAEEIAKTPLRAALGYGPGSTEVLQIETWLPYSNRTVLLWSWDNHYAAHLLEYGYLGLVLLLSLHLMILYKLFTAWRRVDPADKNLLAAIIAGAVVMMFMMTNVRIFAPHLHFLYWSLVGSGLVLDRRGAQYRVQIIRSNAASVPESIPDQEKVAVEG